MSEALAVFGILTKLAHLSLAVLLHGLSSKAEWEKTTDALFRLISLQNIHAET